MIIRYCLRCGVELNEWRIKDSCIKDSWCIHCGIGERWEDGVLVATTPRDLMKQAKGMWTDIPEGDLVVMEWKPE